MLCRVCKSKHLEAVLDLGYTALADDFLTESDLTLPEVHYPLSLVICRNCKLVQLTYVVPPDLLYRDNYPYVSSTTETGINHYRHLAQSVCRRFNIRPGSLAVDIGSNVGVLLAGFGDAGMRVIGIEPVGWIAEVANDRGIETVNDFFSVEVAQSINRNWGRAAIVTGTNVVAHINDLHELISGVKEILDEKGVFIVEAPYLTNLIDNLEYDTIYHEHLSYLSIQPMMALLARFDMEVFDVEEVSIHGGTLRYYLARAGEYTVSDTVNRMAMAEELTYDQGNLEAFAVAVQRHRMELRGLLCSLKRDGKRIAAVSAPAKGMTLLQYCGIGRDIIDFVTEKAPEKIGKYTPGTHIVVVPDEQLLCDPPDYALLLAWNFSEEIMRNLRPYSEMGGKFIVPIPSPRIV